MQAAAFRAPARSSGQTPLCPSGRLSGHVPRRMANGSGERTEGVPIGSAKKGPGQAALRLASSAEGRSKDAPTRATVGLRQGRSQSHRTKMASASPVNCVRTAARHGLASLENGRQKEDGPLAAKGRVFAKMASRSGEAGRRSGTGSEGPRATQVLRSENCGRAREVMPTPRGTRGPLRSEEGHGQTLV